jgi:hypothetical protein
MITYLLQHYCCHCLAAITYQFTKAEAHSNQPWLIRADKQDKVRKEMVSKIHGQRMNQDLTILKEELIAILTNIPTTL